MRTALRCKWVSGLLGAMLACCLVLPVKALTLFDAYQSALLNDPFFKSGTFAAQAGAEESNLGLSHLLPEITLSARKMDNRASRDQFSNSQVLHDNPTYQSLGGGVFLRQPLFNPEQYSAYKQGGLRAAMAESQLEKDRQDAILRITSVFLDAVIAGQETSLAVAQKQAAAAKAEQASRFLSGGEGTSVEVDDAQSGLELAMIQENEAADNLAFSISQLSQLTAREVDGLPELSLDASPADTGNETSKNLDQWLESAMAHNPELAKKRHDLESVKKGTQQYLLSGNLPTVDLVANITRNNRDSINTLNLDVVTRAIGIEVNWPLFKGGYYSAMVRQSRDREGQARQDVEGAGLRIRLEVERQYKSMISGRGKLAALLRQIQVEEKKVVAAELAFKAGISTSVDILSVRKDLQQSVKNYGDTFKEYVIARLKLESLSGSLGDSNIKWVEKFFKAAESNGAMAPDCPTFRSACTNVSHDPAPREIPRQGVTVKRTRAGFHHAGLDRIPYTSLNRDRLIAQHAWLGARQAVAFDPGTSWLEQTINGCRRDQVRYSECVRRQRMETGFVVQYP